MFLHVFYSWLLTQVFHPLCMVLLGFILNGAANDSFEWSMEFIFLFVLVSLIASLPCLLLGWLFLGLIVYSNYTVTAKFIFWLVTAAILVILNFWALVLFFDPGFRLEYFLAAVPGIISIWTASIFRVRQFQKLIYKQQNNDHATDLV
jgi:hypothetical protein